MNELFSKIKVFAITNKTALIRVGAAVVGAAIGATLAGLIGGEMEDGPMIDLLEDDLDDSGIDEEDETEE